MKNLCISILVILTFAGCWGPKEALFNLMSNIKTKEAVYENTDGSMDTLQMGFKFHKPAINLKNNKPYRVITKQKKGDTKLYSLRSIWFDDSNGMELVKLNKKDGQIGQVRLASHMGEIKKYSSLLKDFEVYKQTYNQNKNPKNNYCEYFIAELGLILSNNKSSFTQLIFYNGEKLTEEFTQLQNLIIEDSAFFEVDTVTIFETWEEIF